MSMRPTAVPTRAAALISATLVGGESTGRREPHARSVSQPRALCWYPPVGGVIPAGGAHRYNHLRRRWWERRSGAARRPHGLRGVVSHQAHIIAHERRPVPVRHVQHRRKSWLAEGPHSDLIDVLVFRSHRGPPQARTCGPHAALRSAHPATRRWRGPPAGGERRRRPRSARPSAGCLRPQTRVSVCMVWMADRGRGRVSEGLASKQVPAREDDTYPPRAVLRVC